MPHATAKELAEYLATTGALHTPMLMDAFARIDRKEFVLPEYQDEAYADDALPIGYEQTISQPTTVAIMLELLQPQPGERILDLGAGSGWTTALLAHCVGTNGEVIGIEIIPELAAMGRKNLEKIGFTHAHIYEAQVALGWPDSAPYDRILVSATTDEIPRDLVAQLRVGGVMVIPIRTSIVKATKNADDTVDTEQYEGFIFVPLVKRRE